MGSDDVPNPACNIGGATPSKNGCPMDAPVPPTSKAFPVCLAKGKTDDPYTNGEFHCALACPCESVEDDGCGAAADSHCPVGATCQRCELCSLFRACPVKPASFGDSEIHFSDPTRNAVI